MEWREILSYDPLEALQNCGYGNIAYFTQKDLLEIDPGPVQSLWEIGQAKSFTGKQAPEGYWKYPGRKEDDRFPEDYLQIETYRILGFLVEKYGFDRRSPVIRSAADFLLGCQTEVGDLRGIYGNQYSPNYSAAIFELLIKAGYGNEPRVLKGLRWLLSMKQDDGGWSIPLRTIKNIELS